MDLEGAAALSVCARCEEQRLEGQHERICPVASGVVPGIAAQSAGAAAATQGAQCEEARAGTPYVRLTAACVSSNTRHHAAVLRACRARRRQRERGKLFVRVSCAAALCASGKTGTLLRVAV